LAVGALFEAPTRRADLDNLWKSLSDGLKVAFNDRQVEAFLVVYLRNPKPRIEVAILPWRPKKMRRIIETLVALIEEAVGEDTSPANGR